MTAAGRRSAGHVPIVLVAVLLAAGCGSAVPAVPASTDANGLPGTAIGTPSAPPTSAAPTVPLSVDVGGTIACATFPYGCKATLSVLPVGTSRNPEWRPSRDDPSWAPDWVGTTTDHFEPTPLKPLPRLGPGASDVVVLILGSYDTPSYLPDGSVAHDLLGQCGLTVLVQPSTTAVHLGLTFAPGENFQTSCTIRRL